MSRVLGDRHEAPRYYDGSGGELPPHKRRFYSRIRNADVLDLGCGAGTAARFLRASGNTVFGVTSSSTEAEQAAKVIAGVEVADLDALMELPFGGRRFDVVLLGDVLEHLKFPHTLLCLARGALKTEGRLYVSLPNVANVRVRLGLLCGNFRYEESGILDKTHLRFFTLVTARGLLTQAGYCIEAECYSNWNWCLLPSRILRLLRLRRVEQLFRDLLTKLYPGLFATQVMLIARPAPDQTTDLASASWGAATSFAESTGGTRASESRSVSAAPPAVRYGYCACR